MSMHIPSVPAAASTRDADAYQDDLRDAEQRSSTTKNQAAVPIGDSLLYQGKCFCPPGQVEAIGGAF
jgi:hypothetical protein